MCENPFIWGESCWDVQHWAWGLGPPCSCLPDSQCFKPAVPVGKQPSAVLRLSQEELAPPLIPQKYEWVTHTLLSRWVQVGGRGCRDRGCVCDLLQPETRAGRGSSSWTKGGAFTTGFGPSSCDWFWMHRTIQASGPEARSAAREPVVRPTCPQARRRGHRPSRCRAGYLHRGPPWARPGLVQLVGVLRRMGLAYVHVTGATV